MTTRRYQNIRVITNDSELYDQIFEQKNVDFIRQHETVTIDTIPDEWRETLTETFLVWKNGDRMYKLAAKYYGDPRYWWVIAQYNKRPTDSHFSNGDLVVVPSPLQDVLNMMGK